jgi:protein O-mannosyl-transferase
MNPERIKSHPNLQNIITAAIILFILLITFYPVFESKFTNWDDPLYVTRNMDIRSLSPANVWRIFTSFCCGHYHPLTVLSFAAEYSAYDLSPFFYHADNLLLHYFNTLLLLWLLLLITKNTWASLLASLLFAIHPMHVESVAWVSGRKDVLYTLFYLSSFISYIYYRQNNKHMCLALSLGFFILALLAKESAVTLPLSLIAYDYLVLSSFNPDFAIAKSARRAAASRLAGLAGLTPPFGGALHIPHGGTIAKFGFNLKDKAVFLILALAFGAIAIYSEKVSGAMITERHLFSAQTLLGLLYAFLFYIEKLFFPFNLSCFYISVVFSKEFLFKTIAAASVLTLCFVFYKNKKEALFALVFYFINIVLFFQFIPVGYAVVCDRYTYLPYIGLTMIIAGGMSGLIEHNINFRKYIIPAAILFIVYFAFCANKRCDVWHDSYTLWSDAIKNSQLNYRAFANRGFAEMEGGFNDAALADFKRSVELNFNTANVHFAMGNIYFSKKQYDMAVESYLNATKVDPSSATSHFYLGLAYNMKDMDSDALEQFAAAARLNPNYMEAYYAQGNTYFKIKQYGYAVNSFTEALKRSLDNYLLYDNRGYAYFMLGDNDKALVDLEKAVELNPGYDTARKHLAEALKSHNGK